MEMGCNGSIDDSKVYASLNESPPQAFRASNYEDELLFQENMHILLLFHHKHVFDCIIFDR